METECCSLSSAATRLLTKSELEKFSHFRQTMPKNFKSLFATRTTFHQQRDFFWEIKFAMLKNVFFPPLSAFVWRLIEKRGNRGKADFFRIQKKDWKTNSAPQKSLPSPKLSKSKVMLLFFFEARELRFFGVWSVEFKSVIDIALSEKAHL